MKKINNDIRRVKERDRATPSVSLWVFCDLYFAHKKVMACELMVRAHAISLLACYSKAEMRVMVI